MMAKKRKHPPHWYGDGYFFIVDGIKTHVLICLKPQCDNRKETVATV